MTLASMKLIAEELEKSETLGMAKSNVLNQLGKFHHGLPYDEVTLDEFSEVTGLPKYLGHPMNMQEQGKYGRPIDDLEAGAITARIMQEIVVNYFKIAGSYDPPEDRASQHPQAQEIMALKAA